MTRAENAPVKEGEREKPTQYFNKGQKQSWHKIPFYGIIVGDERNAAVIC